MQISEKGALRNDGNVSQRKSSCLGNKVGAKGESAIGPSGAAKKQTTLDLNGP